MKHALNTIVKQFKNKSFGHILQKLLSVIYGYPLYALSFITPRNKNKILVGSHTPFNDNSKYFFMLTSLGEQKRVIWIAHNKEIAQKITAMGFESYQRWSIKGLYHSLTAKFYVFCFHLIDINFWTSGNVIKINLWHGVPLKNIEFSVKSGSSVSVYNQKNIVSRIFAPYIFVRPDCLIATSNVIAEYYTAAFRVNHSAIHTFGQPRCDIFFMDKKQLHEKFIQHDDKLIKIINTSQQYAKVFIYMPTWRDYDFFFEAGIDFLQLNSALAELNYYFVIKTHPATVINSADVNQLSNIEILTNDMDVYPLLPFTDCLITDYSSIYYDYILLEKEIILFAFDEYKYASEDRGFIWDYADSMLANKVRTFSALLVAIAGNNFLSNEHLALMRQRYWGEYKGNAVSKLDELLNHYPEDNL